jgi:hypothetical protein
MIIKKKTALFPFMDLLTEAMNVYGRRLVDRAPQPAVLDETGSQYSQTADHQAHNSEQFPFSKLQHLLPPLILSQLAEFYG